MKTFKFFLLLGVGCLAIGAWARSPAEADAETTARRLSEQRRSDLRAALKASQGRSLIGLDAPQEALDPNLNVSEEERVQRRQQLRQQLREVRNDLP